MVTEGELRCKELSTYLDKMNAPRTVWLSEDGSGINTKISYDSTTNQLVGLVLPFNDENGMPISFTYRPKSAKDMEEMIKNPKSTHIYVVMAQPIKSNTQSFILQMFGTDNKFTGLNVSNRWSYTKKELLK